MCNCIESVENNIREKTGDQLAQMRGTLGIDGNKLKFMPTIEVLYRKKKSDGTFAKNKTSIELAYDFCPFCGQPLYNKEETE